MLGRADLELEAANINSTANRETAQDGTAQVRELGTPGSLPVVASPRYTQTNPPRDTQTKTAGGWDRTGEWENTKGEEC